ncbi:class I SAM-dependent methyltransferase [Paenibacillus flagellatus]|nr:class I SAM-dependent methyltransferase [Paenibacillus flagellatus]
MNNREHYEQIGVAMTCRGFAEYERMFGLDSASLVGAAVLDVAAGASSFAAEARARGIAVHCADPRYELSPERIREEGLAEIESSSAKLSGLADKFDWSYYGDIGKHRAGRLESLRTFLREYEDPSTRSQYYKADRLPSLPFADDRFDLVLCSHFLFLYRDAFDDAFHRAAMAELLRVCRPGGEVRVYPLLSLRWEPYPALAELLSHLESLGAACELRPSALPFIPGSTELLVVRKK